MHLTETCEDDQPHLITGVMTTPATTPDCVMGPLIQDDLAARHPLPSIHLLDGGYVDAELLALLRTSTRSMSWAHPSGRIATNGGQTKAMI